MAINTIKATIQMRRGMEEDFDPDQMVAGEWAVSTDLKYVRMCFAPGLCYRMATYEAFEEDMKEIQIILATCQNIQIAVEKFAELAEQHKTNAEEYSVESKSWAVGGTNTRAGEDTDNSKYYSEQSKTYFEETKKTGNDALSAINNAIDVSKPEFEVDLDTGHLLYSGGKFDFNVNNKGHLEWGLTL